ncbi:MAG: hypothetical protein PHR35_14880 [Kiritimatiellae bacterium]|nr:hypothetical protein [Kiritimatiellia bacterium]
MNEEQLVDRLRRVENLYAGAATAGEREAAASAAERIRGRLKDLQVSDPPIERSFRLPDVWSRRLLVALMRRYGIRPYRYAGQRHTTVMAQVSRGFVELTLWPEFLELDGVLRRYLEETTERVIREGLDADTSEAEVRNALPGGVSPG